MQEAVPVGEGGMAAIIGVDRDKIVEVCQQVSAESPVQAVNFNCPGQIVIAGATKGVELAVEELKAAGAKKAVILPVSAPFHSTLMKPAAEKLAVIAGVNLKEYGMAMLKAGADLGDLTPAQIAKTDSKPFSFGKYKAIVAQISVMDTADILAKKAELVAAMQELCQNEGYDMSLLMVTDIMEESTELVFVGEPKQLIADAFGKDASGDSIYLPGVMSRKKQIVPQLTEAAAKL